jgi:hypothetical protein
MYTLALLSIDYLAAGKMTKVPQLGQTDFIGK